MQHFIDELVVDANADTITSRVSTIEEVLDSHFVKAHDHELHDLSSATSSPFARYFSSLLSPVFCNSTSGTFNSSAVAHHRHFVSLLTNLTETLKNFTSSFNNDPGGGFKDSDEHAVYYIVVVLLFYSFGIVFMMVKYMRKERQELEETKMYKEYVKAARDRCTQSKFVPANRLALTALNTVNVIAQPCAEEKITFV